MEKQALKHIVIIGAGPAGCLLTKQLADSDYQLTLIDRYPQAKRKVCGEYLCPSGVSLFEGLGLDIELEQHFHKLWGMKLVAPNSTAITTFFPEDAKIKNYGLSINRQIFDQALREQVVGQKNVKTYFGETFLDIEKQGDQWLIKTTNQQLVADLVVGADGINSLLAKKLGHRKTTSSNRIALHAYLKTKSPGQYSRIGQMHILGDGSYCGLNPINQDEINFSIVCNAERLKNKKPYQLLNCFIAAQPALGEMFEPLTAETVVSTLCPITLTNTVIARDAVAYVGDAAGFIDPLTGEGIYNALLSAKLLSHQLLTQNNLESALKNYKREKQKVFRAKSVVNHVFQYIIKKPMLANLIARFLKTNQKRANAFIGIIGNIYTPLEGFMKIFFPSKRKG